MKLSVIGALVVLMTPLCAAGQTQSRDFTPRHRIRHHARPYDRANAADSRRGYANGPANFAPDGLAAPRTETDHSLSVNMFGIHYAWEFPVDRIATIVVRPGAQVAMSWGVDDDHHGDGIVAALMPTVDVEPRVYYNLDRRAARGLDTYGNQGNFVALQIKTVPPFCLTSDIYRPRIAGLTIISPMWGIRRVWGGHWMFEFAGGMSMQIVWKRERENRRYSGGIRPFAPTANIRLGYSF